MKEISKALVRAQRQFGPALKSSNNPHFRSKYADLSACVEAVIDALNENGIFLTQPTHECEGGVMVETVFLHESGEMFSAGKLFVPASKKDAQGYGSAQTYARRYSLMSACGIAPEDDDGNAASKTHAPKHGAVKNDPAVENATPEEREALSDIAMEAMGMVKDGKPTSARDFVKAQNLDNDQKTLLWSLLDAPTRSALKTAEKAPQIETA